VRALRLSVALTVITLGLAGCSGSSRASATGNDRAACTQLRSAFAAFTAQTDANAPPLASYLKALKVAQHADNVKLRNAIVAWMTFEMGNSSRTDTGSSVSFAMDACRKMGLGLHVVPPTTTTVAH
jgi:hypothetical protein